jgi:prepilin-type N-terminal cleavage/methylation domain-containing protein
MWAKNKQSGFTIVELLIVIVVIGILAAITVVAYANVRDRAQASAVANGLNKIEKAFRLKLVDDGVQSWWLDNSSQLAGISNASIQQIIDGSNMKDYIQQTPVVNGMPSIAWNYDYDGDTYNGCSVTSTGGVNIYIQNFSNSNVAQLVDEEIDDGNINCGSVTFSGTSFRYNMSRTSAL